MNSTPSDAQEALRLTFLEDARENLAVAEKYLLAMDAGALGYECAGVVARAGDGAPFAVGDRVMALASGGFSRFVTLDARYVAATSAG